MAPAGYGSRVEGLHAVVAAAAAGRVRRLWVESRRLRRAEVRAIAEAVAPQAMVETVDDVRQYAETEAPQGVVADCVPILPVSLDRIVEGHTALVVLDHIEDPHNLGAIARSASAAGMTGMVVSSKRQAPLSAAAFKSAAGALETLPVSVVGSIPEALSRLKTAGVWVVGLDSRSETELFDLELLTERVAVVVGAEGAGLSALAAKRCDLLARIPMAPGNESLNVSVSAAVGCFEIMRVRREAPPAPG